MKYKSPQEILEKCFYTDFRNHKYSPKDIALATLLFELMTEIEELKAQSNHELLCDVCTQEL